MDDKILKHKLEDLKNSRSKYENLSKMLNVKKTSITTNSKTPSSKFIYSTKLNLFY